jgi:hypothetical protein
MFLFRDVRLRKQYGFLSLIQYEKKKLSQFLASMVQNIEVLGVNVLV